MNPIVGTKTIDDGVYQISTKSNEKALSVDDSLLGDGISLSDNINSRNQKFSIKYLNNGYYNISLLNSQKSLDVCAASQLAGTKIQQWDSNNTDAQKWVIQKNNDGSYSIISKCNDLYIDIPGGSLQNGTKLQVYIGNGSMAQKFNFAKIDPIIGTRTIDNGIYNIVLNIDGNKYLTDTDTSIKIKSKNGSLSQQFKISYISDGCYSISPVISNNYVGIDNSYKNNTLLKNIYTDISDAKEWIIKETNDGYYNIISKYNDLCMDIPSANPFDGNNIQLYTPNGTSAQKFQIIKSVIYGIDVSSNQKDIDFDKIKNNQNIDFMIARIGYYNTDTSSFVEDSKFKRNYEYATSNNIKLGGYLYSYARNVDEAKQEANGLVEYLKNSGQTKFDLPIFFDIEDSRQKSIDMQTQTQMCIEFGKIIQAAGYKAGVYSYLNWYKNYIDLSQIPSTYSIWLAAFGINDGNIPDNDIYKYFEGHDIWQYTSQGVVDGIKAYVDLDIYYRSK